MSEVVEFWSGKSLSEAKSLIIGNVSESTWKAHTEEAMPRLLTPVVLANLPGRELCVDIGAGIGRILDPMTKYFTEAVGVDISPVMVEYSKGYLKDIPAAWVELTDGTLPLLNSIADFVYSYICFQHLQSYDEVKTYLSEAIRVLKPKGVIRVQTHCGEPNVGFQEMHGCHYQSLDAFVQEFIDAGFTILESERGITHVDSLWVTAQKAGQ
jgi:ubiquinone/menaquinone biosynthesis C-methylase UbiE